MIYVMVMANAFHTRNKIHERYDLKVRFLLLQCSHLISDHTHTGIVGE